jgi:two-component system OmpR family sensor kinase
MDPATVGDERRLEPDGRATVPSFLPARTLSPRRITSIYLAFGLVALVLSDLIFLYFLDDPLLRWVQAAKGVVEVVLTGGLIYLLTSASYESLRRTADEAERNKTELQLLHRVLRHNIRNNLTLVLGNARRLEDSLEDPADRALCEEVVAAAAEIDHWTEEAGKIRRASGGADRYDVDLGEALASVIGESERIDGEAIDVRIDDPSPVVRVSPQFELALEELLVNAQQHADASPVRVDVGRDGGRAAIEISDDGPGFPDHVLTAVNERGEDELVHLDGLGLWLAYLVVASSMGELVLENTADGATAHISVPTA